MSVYADGYYRDAPVVTRNGYGKGAAMYQAARDTGSLKDAVLAKVCQELGICSVVDTAEALPHGVTAHSRTDGEHTYVFVENYNDHEVAPVRLRGSMEDLLTGEETESCTLGAYGYGIFKSK